jgi:hypothetical protein
MSRTGSLASRLSARGRVSLRMGTYHVVELKDNETTSEGGLAGKTDRVASAARRDTIGVDANVCNIVIGVDQAAGLGGRTVDIVDESVGWIVVGEEVEVIEEAAAREVLGQVVCGECPLQQGSRGEESVYLHLHDAVSLCWSIYSGMICKVESESK